MLNGDMGDKSKLPAGRDRLPAGRQSGLVLAHAAPGGIPMRGAQASGSNLSVIGVLDNRSLAG